MEDEGEQVVMKQILGGKWAVALIWGVLSRPKRRICGSSNLKGIKYNLLCS